MDAKHGKKEGMMFVTQKEGKKEGGIFLQGNF